MSETDETLLEKFKQGDLAAFRNLVERYSGPIYNLAFRLLRDSMEAENVAQETFLRLITALNRIRLDLPIKPYLFRIAVNLCYDHMRREKPLLFTELDAANKPESGLDPASELIEGEEVDLLDRIEAEELRAQLSAAIDALPPDYQTVILLRFVEGLSYEEIAQTVEIPLNTVRTQLRRAKARLRAKLEKDLRIITSQHSPLRLQTARGDSQ